MDMKGASALITGGGAGIGRAAALALAGRGVDVAIIDIDATRAEAVATEVQLLGCSGLAMAVDVRDQVALRDAVDAAASQFGRLDTLVNNAGGVRAGLFANQTERSWRNHLEINLMSMLTATSAAIPAMIDGRRGGAIVNVASIEGTRAAPMFGVYGACKAAMISFTRTMAVELAEHGIRANAVAPDWVRTPGNSGVPAGPVPDELPPRSESMARNLRAYVPLGREGVDTECGEVIAFLCSPAASYVNGATVPVDGGTWASSGWTRTSTGTWSLFGAEPMV